MIYKLIYYLFKPKSKHTGARGEGVVATKLKALDNKKYMVLDNVLFQTQWGSSQIDHVVISVYGIFVIETKTYKGWIHGHEKSCSGLR